MAVVEVATSSISGFLIFCNWETWNPNILKSPLRRVYGQSFGLTAHRPRTAQCDGGLSSLSRPRSRSWL